MCNSDSTIWAAGLFEGEGCIQVRPNGVWLSLGMTDRDVVERFCAAVGAGGICTQRGQRTKPIHVWHLGKRSEVARILSELLPWFGERRTAKALKALSFIATFNRACGWCGDVFLAGRNDRVYCCNACSLKARRARDAARVAA